MAFTLENVVPWGRSLDEYVSMFDLSETDLESTILGCGDGPASFNMEMHQKGRRVISADPVYRFTEEEIRSRIDATYRLIMEQIGNNMENFIWEQAKSPEHLGKNRMATMERFLADFNRGKTEKRYLAYSLPELPFDDHGFDLALCSHFLFLYPDQLSLEFHIAAIKEMLRVAKEVRIFPLLTLDCEIYPRMEKVYEWIEQSGHKYKVETVKYEFQRGGNQMIRIRQITGIKVPFL